MPSAGRRESDHERPSGHRRKRLLPSPAMAVAMLALCLAVGGVAVAAIPGPGGVIKACYRDAPGGQRPLSIVDTDAECPSPFVLLPLNQQGPAGPQGPGGPQGVAGPAGPAGPAGVTTLYSAPPIATSNKVIGLKANEVRKVAALNLPAGAFLVTAKASVHLSDSDTAPWKNLDKEYRLYGQAFGACELWIVGPGQPVLGDKADLRIDRYVRYSLGGGAKPILGPQIVNHMFSEGTVALMHAASVSAVSKVELRCTGGAGIVELSHVKLVALPAAGLSVGQLNAITLKPPTTVQPVKPVKRKKPS